MSKFEVQITLDLPDGIDAGPIIEQIQRILSTANGKETIVNIVEVDDPVSVNPIIMHGGK
jgi:hypothetical protein